MMSLTVPYNFDQKLMKLFQAGDEKGVETMTMLFGTIDGLSGRITDVVAPPQLQCQTACELTENWALELTEWQDGQSEKQMLGWAHSHRTMTLVPSVIDLQNQWEHQHEHPWFVMAIRNLSDGCRVWRLNETAMQSLTATRGKAPDGTDTTSLLEVTALTAEGYRIETWTGSMPLGQEDDKGHNDVYRRIHELEAQVAQQARDIIDLRAEVRKLAGEKRRCPATDDVDADSCPEPPKKPPSAFALFSTKILADLAGSAASQAKQATEKWQGMDDAEKKAFQDEAGARLAEYSAARDAFKRGGATPSK